ncbi:MAG: DMT family transporter [Bacteroidales bacterium]
MENQKKSYLYASLVILFWGTSATAFKLGLKSFNYIQLLFWSSFFATIILFSALTIQGKIKELISTTPKDFIKSLLQGFLNPFLYYFVLFQAYSLLPAQVAQPLNYVWPIVLVLLAALFLKQKLHWYDFTALLLSFIGVTFISSQGQIDIFSASKPVGVALALLSSLVWASFWIINVRDQKQDEVVKLFLSFSAATLFSIIPMILTDGFKIFSQKGIFAAIFIGTFEMGITFVLWLKAMKYARNTAKLGNFIYLVPFVALLFVSYFLHEKIIWTTIIGLIIIIGAILFQQFLSNNKKSM